MAEVMLEVDIRRADLFMNWLLIVESILLIIGCAENPLKSQMTVPNNLNEGKL